ncbi:MAG TPA: Wzz/FepE/Etk N-terminal domain-containing protein [Phenylobacterium sp.]|nr:Wzz/FepE/Etk N-terminal domain-containing protein [Phenylobacterium sp.]
MIALLWRERMLMLAVFLVLFALGLGAALMLKTKYPAYSSVLVRLGQEYVYEPRAGDAARGAVPDSDQLVQSETEILGSAQLKQRVITKLGLAAIYPKLADKYARARPAGKRLILSQAVHAMDVATKIETAPDVPIIKVSYEADDPDRAALVLNTLLEEYLTYRHAVLGDAGSPALEAQRSAFEQRLGQVDQAYEAFLTNNRIGDFVAEKASLSQLQSQIEQQKLQTESQLQDRIGRLAALSAQLAGVSSEVGLYRDVSSAANDKLASLKVQREDLLSRYRNDSRPVQELDAQIAQLEAGMAAGRTHGDGARRFGVNPVFQTLQTEKIQLTAEVAALRKAQAAQAGQIEQLMQRRLKFAALEPQFQELSLNRDVLQANVRDYTVKEEQNRAAQQIAATSNDNIRVVSRATPPIKGQSLKRPVAVLALLFAAFTALCVGLVRMFLRPGLATPSSAERTFDLPVLGAAPFKA